MGQSIKRVGRAPDAGRKYITRPGVYAILPFRGSLLLTLQDFTEPEIQLPGGGIDPGESPITALHREVYEETGWSIARPRRLGAFRRFTYMPEYDMWSEKVCTVYTACPIQNLGPATEPDHQAVFMAPDLATRMLYNSGDQMFVQSFFGIR